MSAFNSTDASVAVQHPMMFGTDARKLCRIESNDTSRHAALSVDTTRLESMVYEAVCKFSDGCIQDDILDLFPGFPYSSVTARFRSLLDKGLIVDTGERRKGRSGRPQRVLVGGV